MKIDIVYFMIAIAISFLLSYGLWSIAGDMALFIAIGAALYLGVTLGMAMGVRHDNARLHTNLSALSGLFFLLGLMLNVLFCFAGNIPVIYIMTTAISLLAYLGIFYFLQNAKLD